MPSRIEDETTLNRSRVPFRTTTVHRDSSVYGLGPRSGPALGSSYFNRGRTQLSTTALVPNRHNSNRTCRDRRGVSDAGREMYPPARPKEEGRVDGKTTHGTRNTVYTVLVNSIVTTVLYVLTPGLLDPTQSKDNLRTYARRTRLTRPVRTCLRCPRWGPVEGVTAPPALIPPHPTPRTSPTHPLDKLILEIFRRNSSTTTRLWTPPLPPLSGTSGYLPRDRGTTKQSLPDGNGGGGVPRSLCTQK